MVVAEGAQAKDGHRELLAPAEVGHAERLGGMGESIAHALSREHRQGDPRGGAGASAARRQPNLFRPPGGLRFGAAAVRALDEGHSGVMVSLGGRTA